MTPRKKIVKQKANFKPKPCEGCGVEITPTGAAQKWCRGCALVATIARKRGLTVDLRADLFMKTYENQGGKCAICFDPISFAGLGFGPPAHLDHDHETGAVRGFLCFACNCGIGHFKDDILRLLSAVTYLRDADQTIPQDAIRVPETAAMVAAGQER